MKTKIILILTGIAILAFVVFQIFFNSVDTINLSKLEKEVWVDSPIS